MTEQLFPDANLPVTFSGSSDGSVLRAHTEHALAAVSSQKENDR